MLKLLACFLMLLDHIGYYFADVLPGELYLLLRCLGRLAFPIFAWSVALGYRRTSHPVRYFVRMSFFAVITEILFIFFHNLDGRIYPGSNVLVLFSVALVMLSGFQLAFHSTLDLIASLRPVSPTPQTLPSYTRYDVRVNIGGIELDRRVGLPLGLAMMLAAVAATLWLHPDYGLYGLASILLFYIIHDRLPERLHERYAVIGFSAINVIYTLIRIFANMTPVYWAILQCLSVLALPICYARIRERKPSALAKYAFYAFYPLHVVLLLLIRIILWPK